MAPYFDLAVDHDLAVEFRVGVEDGSDVETAPRTGQALFWEVWDRVRIFALYVAWV